jgi:predicted RNA-binding protein with TRAM domain
MYGDRNNGYGQRPQPPVSVDEELDVTVEAVGAKGDGIVKKDGFVIFVPGVNEGDRVRIKITKVLSKVGFAEVVGEASSAPAEESEETSASDLPDEASAQEETYSDSEDFGEEAPAEEVAEEPAMEEASFEETAEEMPAEEPAEEEAPAEEVAEEPAAEEAAPEDAE